MPTTTSRVVLFHSNSSFAPQAKTFDASWAANMFELIDKTLNDVNILEACIYEATPNDSERGCKH
jgi:hypothetical protein